MQILEVLCYIIHNNSFLHISAKERQVFQCILSFTFGVLSIESVRNAFMLVNLVKNPIGIVLKCRCKYDYLIKLGKLVKESSDSWPHKIENISFNFM